MVKKIRIKFIIIASMAVIAIMTLIFMIITAAIFYRNDEQILMLGCHGDGFYSTRGVRILTFFTP